MSPRIKRPFRNRFWTYGRKQWVPRWWNMAGIPQVRGTGDEQGYKCFIWGTGLTGYVVFAWWRCGCWDCRSVRMVNEAMEVHGYEVAEEVDAALHRIRLLDLSGR